MKSLQGKVAIVSGAARGMGAADALRLAEEGASVVIADVLDDEAAALAERIGEKALFLHLDVTSQSDWQSVIEATVRHFGRIDILVNNAGILYVAPIPEISVARFRESIEINLIGALLGIQAVAPQMLKAGGGSIINIASINGLRGGARAATYAATKHALLGLTKSAAVDLGPSGIRVNAVCPGPINTAMLTQSVQTAIKDNTHQDRASNIALRRVGEPAEIASLVAFLASDDSSYCNGTEFVVDGGYICKF